MAASIHYPAHVEPLAPSVEPVSASSWHPPQQGPVPHRFYRPASATVRGVDGTEITAPAETITQDKWGQPQQAPVPHTRPDPRPGVVAGAEPALLEAPTLRRWEPPQQTPVPHRFYRPASGAVAGVEPTFLEAPSQAWWQRPQQDPVRHRRHPGTTEAAGQPLEPLLFPAAEVVTPDKWFREAQSPVPHRKFRPASGGVAGQVPALLEAVTQTHWLPAAQPPARRRPSRASLPAAVATGPVQAPGSAAGPFFFRRYIAARGR